MSRFVLTVAHDLGSLFLQDAEMGGQEELGVEVDWLVVDGLGQAGLLEALEALCQVVLDGCEGGDDGGGAEPVGGVGEVGEVTLDLWLEDHGRLRVAQR